MKTVESGKGGYGYTYVLTFTVTGGKTKQERYKFWFDSPTLRESAMALARNSIKGAGQWRKIGK